MTPSLEPRAPLAVLGVALLLGAPGVARADAEQGPCPLRLTPAEASPAWKEAAAQAAARLARLEAPHDCRAVEVSVGEGEGATLAFLTTDGRGAARSLDTPADLAPTLEALLVTRIAPPAPPAPPLAPTPPRVEPPAPPPASTAPAASPARVVELHLAAALGGRVAFVPQVYLAPTLALRPSISVGRWEVGAFADYAPRFAPTTFTAPEGFTLSSLATGIFLGVRERVGAWSVGAGAALGVQSVNEDADALPELAVDRSLDVAQPRAGVYGKGSYPATAPLRFFAQLDVDAVLGRLRDKAAAERQLPGLPRFGLDLAFGVEASLP